VKNEGKEEGRRRGRSIEYLKGTKVLSLNYYLMNQCTVHLHSAWTICTHTLCLHAFACLHALLQCQLYLMRLAPDSITPVDCSSLFPSTGCAGMLVYPFI